MTVFRASEVSGFNVPMKITNMKHIVSDGLTTSGTEKRTEGESFATLLRNAFYDLNSVELRKDNMMQQFIVDPNSVNIEDLTISLAKAELSFGFARSVAEKVISAYREISNLR